MGQFEAGRHAGVRLHKDSCPGEKMKLIPSSAESTRDRTAEGAEFTVRVITKEDGPDPWQHSQ